jgi:hypothetical protein
LDEIHLLNDALSEAGGEWAKACPEKQAHHELQDNPDGWARYAQRMRSKVRLIVGDRQTYAIANGLIGEARRLYEGLRRRAADRN